MNCFFSDGGLTPHFFHTHFLRRRSYPSSFHLSILWSSPGGEELLVATVPQNRQKIWNHEHVILFLFSDGGLTPHFFSYFHFVNPLVFTRWKRSPGLHQGGQGVPKNHRTMLGDSFSGTAAGCIVSVGDVGLNAHHVWLKNPCFLVYFSINLVVLSPWLCAINSVDPISSSDFYGPMLWFTAAGWIVSVGDAGRM